MLTRRQTVVGAVAGAALPTLPTLVACAPNASHAEAVRSVWRHGSASERANITERAIVIEPDLQQSLRRPVQAVLV